MEGRFGALLAIQNFRVDFCFMRQTNAQSLWGLICAIVVAAGCGGCGEGNDGPPQVRIDQIEIINFDPNYPEDPQGEDGNPDFYAVVNVGNEVYFTSEVVYEAELPQRIPFDVTFQGAELDEEVTIVIFEDDGEELEDYVGEVAPFVPRDLMSLEPVRHPLFGGYLEIELLLTW